MKKNTYQLVLCLSALFLSQSTPDSVMAQDQAAATGGLEIAEVKGTLQAASADRLVIKTEEGDDVMVMLDGRSKLTYSGTASPVFLSPGAWVRFNVPIDQKTGVPTAEVKEIEVFRPVGQRRMTREQMMEQTPGVYPASMIKGSKPDEKKKPTARSAKKPSDEKATAAVPVGSEDCRIVARIRMIGQGKAQVLAGNIPLILTISQDVAVKVSSGDTTFCMQGDEVSVAGLRNAAQPQLVQGQTIDIVGAKQLGAVPELTDKGKDGKTGRADKRGSKENVADGNSSKKTNQPGKPTKN
ncbi:MAG: hypothetical protein KDB22_03875 [Planctomycetales bacterium]|nr:hypothetical protein [Planctomycetales bacterium]